jgi:hypothetical protein
MITTETTKPQVPSPSAARETPDACCGPKEQASCCEPSASAKAACCGEAKPAGRCGCR